MNDPYPAMTLEYALKLLMRIYGVENVVHWRVSDRIGVRANYPGEPRELLVIDQVGGADCSLLDSGVGLVRP